jgi:hypothetical protein
MKINLKASVFSAIFIIGMISPVEIYQAKSAGERMSFQPHTVCGM